MNGIELINMCLANPVLHSRMDTIKNINGNMLEVGGVLDNVAMKKVYENNSFKHIPRLTDFEAAKQIIKKTL